MSPYLHPVEAFEAELRELPEPEPFHWRVWLWLVVGLASWAGLLWVVKRML